MKNSTLRLRALMMAVGIVIALAFSVVPTIRYASAQTPSGTSVATTSATTATSNGDFPWLWILLLLVVILLILLLIYWFRRRPQDGGSLDMSGTGVRTSTPGGAGLNMNVHPISTPRMTAPHVDMPAVDSLKADIPSVAMPGVDLSKPKLPDLTMPNVTTPNVTTPNVTTPGIAAPGMEASRSVTDTTPVVAAENIAGALSSETPHAEITHKEAGASIEAPGAAAPSVPVPPVAPTNASASLPSATPPTAGTDKANASDISSTTTTGTTTTGTTSSGATPVASSTQQASQPTNQQASTSSGAGTTQGAGIVKGKPSVYTHSTGAVGISHIEYKGDEYAEISNAGDTPANLSGWVLRDQHDANQLYRFPDGVRLAPGEKLQVYTAPGHEHSFNSKRPIMNDRGDAFELLNRGSQVVSTYAYGIYGTEGNLTEAATGNVDVTTVVIAEVQYAGEEYVLITNKGLGVADLGDWILRDQNDTNQVYHFPAGTTLANGESVQVYTAPGHQYSFNSNRPIWNNNGDALELLDAGGKVMSTYAYGSYLK